MATLGFRVLTQMAVSLVAIGIMTLLVITELRIYFTASIKPELYVDTSLGEQLQINIDVTFPTLPCVCAILPTTLFIP